MGTGPQLAPDLMPLATQLLRPAEPPPLHRAQMARANGARPRQANRGGKCACWHAATRNEEPCGGPGLLSKGGEVPVLRLTCLLLLLFLVVVVVVV